MQIKIALTDDDGNVNLFRYERLHTEEKHDFRADRKIAEMVDDFLKAVAKAYQDAIKET